MGIRRVVTGHDEAGKAIVADDTEVEPITSAIVPGYEFFRLWGGDEPGRFPDDGTSPPAEQYFPPLGGFRFGLFTVPPDSEGSLEDIDFEAALVEVETKLPGMAAHMEPDHPGMHTTASVDYEYVISGRVAPAMHGGTRSTSHAGWSWCSSAHTTTTSDRRVRVGPRASRLSVLVDSGRAADSIATSPTGIE